MKSIDFQKDLLELELYLNESIVKRVIEVRKDPLSLNTTSLSPERANRPKKFSKEGCVFCPPLIYQITASPRIIHQDGSITIPNSFPFLKPHHVTIFPYHKSKIEELDEKDLYAWIETGYEMATIYKKLNVRLMWDFINFGRNAGASIEHPHAQRGGVTKSIKTEADKEISNLKRKMKNLNENPFEYLFKKYKENDLFVFEDDVLFINTPFAPKLPNEVMITYKPEITELTKLKSNADKNKIAFAINKVLHILNKELNVTDFNIVSHYAPFKLDCQKYFKIHWHIYPRNLNNLAGMEMNGHYVVDVFPEYTASILRKNFK
jgi:UDPglucose--hexose-1-phosphate uridylyltransferase